MTKTGLEDGSRSERRSARDVLLDAGAPDMPIKSVRLWRCGSPRVSVGLIFEDEVDRELGGDCPSWPAGSVLMAIAVAGAVAGAVSNASDGILDGLTESVGSSFSDADLEAGSDGLLAEIEASALLVTGICGVCVAGDGTNDLLFLCTEGPLDGSAASCEHLGLEVKLLMPLSMLTVLYCKGRE